MEDALDVAVDGRTARDVHAVVFVVTREGVWQPHGDDGAPSVVVNECERNALRLVVQNGRTSRLP